MPATTTKPASPMPTHTVRLTICIDATPYAVHPLGRDAMPFGAVRAFRLTRADRRMGKVSHVVVEGIEGLACSCGDQTYRRTPQGTICKHLAACQACGLF